MCGEGVLTVTCDNTFTTLCIKEERLGGHEKLSECNASLPTKKLSLIGTSALECFISEKKQSV